MPLNKSIDTNLCGYCRTPLNHHSLTIKGDLSLFKAFHFTGADQGRVLGVSSPLPPSPLRGPPKLHKEGGGVACFFFVFFFAAYGRKRGYPVLPFWREFLVQNNPY